MLEQELKQLLTEQYQIPWHRFLKWIVGHTISTDKDGNTIYWARDIEAFILNYTILTNRMNHMANISKTLAEQFYKEYTTLLQPYKHLVKEVMRCNNLDEMGALVKISSTSAYQSMYGKAFYMSAVYEVFNENNK